MKTEAMNNNFEQPSVAVEKLKKKANKNLYLFLFVLVASVVLFNSSLFQVAELPTLLSVTPQSITLPGVTERSAKFVMYMADIDKSIFLFSITPFVLIFAGVSHSFYRQSYLPFFPWLFAVIVGAWALTITENSIDDIPKDVKKFITREYIEKGDTKGYLEALSQSSPRGAVIIKSVLESNEPNQYDAINLIDTLSKADAQRVSVGLSETMAVEGHLTGEIPVGLPVSAALAAYVIEAAGGTADRKVIDERTGYAIFAEAKKLPDFDKPNPYADTINAQIESGKSRHQLMSNAMAVLTGVAIFLLFLFVSSYRNVKRMTNVIREEVNLRNS